MSKFDRYIKISIAVALLWGFVWLLGYLSDVLIPFAVALLLAYLINPLVILTQKIIRNHFISVLVCLFFIIIILTFLAWLLIPIVLNEIGNMGRILSELIRNTDLSQQAAKRLPPDLWQAIKDFVARKEIQDFFRTDNFWKMVEALVRKILPGVWGLITGTVSFIMGIVGLAVIGLYLIFLLLDYQKVSKVWMDLLPPLYKDKIIGFIREFDSAMNQYFRAQAVVASIVGILFAGGFYIIDLPMGILLGLFIGLLNMVPYLQIIGLIPAFSFAIVHAIETAGSFWVHLALTSLVFVVVQIIQDVILVPKIMGKVTGLSPAVILLSLSIWGKLLGIFGLLIALPMTCLILAYYRRFLVSISPNR